MDFGPLKDAFGCPPPNLLSLSSRPVTNALSGIAMFKFAAYLSAHLISGRGHAAGARGKLYDDPPWLANEEFVAAEFTRYLRGLRDSEPDSLNVSNRSRSPSAGGGKEHAT